MNNVMDVSEELVVYCNAGHWSPERDSLSARVTRRIHHMARDAACTVTRAFHSYY